MKKTKSTFSKSKEVSRGIVSSIVSGTVETIATIISIPVYGALLVAMCFGKRTGDM